MIAEATVDCYNESEEIGALHAAIEEHVRTPFKTNILGVEVTVAGFDLTIAGEIVALCRRARARQTVPILDLPLPSPRPVGAEWIEAYRHWRE